MLTLDGATGLFSLLGDATRLRLLALLAERALSVAEITEVLGVPQSRVSQHLAKLKDAELLVARREGASTFYALANGSMPQSAKRAWELLAGELEDGVVRADALRADQAIRARSSGARWPDAVAGEMERHYSPGRTWEATVRGLLGLVRAGDVLDAGSGDGTLAALVLPRAKSVTLLDRSERMIDAARARLGESPNARFVVGELEAMPLPDTSFDAVMLFNVLTCAEEPERALAEAHRVLRPGGDVTIVTLDRHSHLPVTAPFGHVHAGFAPRCLEALIAGAGLEVEHCAVTSRERREPHFQVVTAFARRPVGAAPQRRKKSR